MTKLCLLNFLLGTQFLQMDNDIFFSQPKYVLNILHRFKIKHRKPCARPYKLSVKLTKECDSLKFDGSGQ